MTAPPGTGYDVPVLQNHVFITRDGLQLAFQRWGPDDPKVIIVALHGMGDYSNAFALPAKDWAAQGIATYAYDQRGFGRSPHPGLWAGGDVMRSDLFDFVDTVRADHPGTPIFVLGESMGGAVVLTSLAGKRLLSVDGVILVAPAVWSREDMPLSYRVALWAAAHVMPWLDLSGDGLDIQPSDNIEMLNKMSRDPLVEKQTRADALYGLVELMDAARKAPEYIKTSPPILFLYGKKDEIIPAEPTKETSLELGTKAEVRSYKNGYHLLLRDLDAKKVRRDVVNWIMQRAALHRGVIAAMDK